MYIIRFCLKILNCGSFIFVFIFYQLYVFYLKFSTSFIINGQLFVNERILDTNQHLKSKIIYK